MLRREFLKLGIMAVSSISSFRSAFRAFRPSPVIRTLAWAIENVVNDQGRPYDHAAFPHLGAPGGPMDAFDDAHVRTISLQWATRLGKTFFGQVSLMKTADTDPAPMLFASSVEKLAKESAARIYASCHKRKRLNELLLKNEREQKQDLIEFRGCKIHVAWSRSVSTLADKNIKVGHGGEWDKWEHQSTSKEAHPHKLYSDRFKDYWATRKEIKEGSPTVKGRSPIERLRIAGTNCKYNVPCPNCKRYQTLEFGKKGESHGIKWDRDEAGQHDEDLACRTARYVCRHCNGECRDYHRPWMMRRGVWVPEGCQVDDVAALAVAEKTIAEPGCHEWNGWRDAAWIIGTPARDGADASYHLSSLYALSLGWGDIAKEFLACKEVKQSLRNFVNQWLGETWAIVEKKQTWEELGGRLIVKTPRRVVPAGYPLLTMGIDKQQEIYVWVVDAWGPDRCSHTVDYGICESEDELKEILRRKWTLETGGRIGIKRALVDCGYRAAVVHALVEDCRREKFRLEACRGSEKPLDTFYLPRRTNKKSANPNRLIIWVDTGMTQESLDHQLHSLQPGDPGSMSLFDGSLLDHQDFLEQLLNDAMVEKLDTKNYITEAWNRIDEGIPNDYRDCRRYSFVAMLRETRNSSILRPSVSKKAENPERGVIKGNRQSIVVNQNEIHKLRPTFNR